MSACTDVTTLSIIVFFGGSTTRWTLHDEALACRVAPCIRRHITPAFDHVDAIGLPRPRISFTVGRYSRDGMAAARTMHERLFTELVATERNHSDIAFGAGHLMGTTVMGADPARSVVDGEGRAHDVRNLFVVGSSVFPTVGTANPTLTLAALALRTADKLRRTLTQLP